MLFGYFLHNAKSDNSFSLQRTSRFCKPQFSSPQWRLHTNKIKTFPKRDSRFCKPRFSAPKQQIRTNKIKSFFFAFRRCPCRDSTLRVLFRLAQKEPLPQFSKLCAKGSFFLPVLRAFMAVFEQKRLFFVIQNESSQSRIHPERC